jgi:hypothetical protein
MGFIECWGREIHREHGGCRWSLPAESMLFFQELLKLLLIYGKGKPAGSHP